MQRSALQEIKIRGRCINKTRQLRRDRINIAAVTLLCRKLSNAVVEKVSEHFPENCTVGVTLASSSKHDSFA